MDLEHERRLAETEQRSKSNSHRIDKLEASTEAINRLATSMEVMSEKQGQMADTVERLDGKVTTLEARPGKRWDGIVDKIWLTVVGTLVGYILSKIGF